MDPTPPKEQRSRGSRKFVNRPFYEANNKTSAEIISEARSRVRALDTKRPTTPAEQNRTLFGKSGKLREGRPPSACSIASSYTDSRPPTGKRLTPLSSAPDFAELESKLQNFENNNLNQSSSLDDSNNNNNNKSYKPQLKNSIIPKSLDPTFSKSRNVKQHKTLTSPTEIQEQEVRRVQSGPKERTSVLESDVLQRSSSFGDISIVDQTVSKKPSSENISDKSINADNVSIFFEENIQPLLKQMQLNELHGDSESLMVNFDVLWNTLEIGNMLGKSTLGSKRRSELLTTVIKCATKNNAILQLKLCRIFLAFEVSGKNLEVVCKLLFQVSRNKKNDEQFLQEKLLGPILSLIMSPSKMSVIDCLVYLTGTLKFLTLNQQCLQELIKHDALKAITSLLQFSMNKLSSDSEHNKESCHMLVQVTSALSNFANVTTLIQKFIDNNILQLLLNLMKTRLDDVDFVMNVSRVFSKFTISENICNNINKEESNSGILINGLTTHLKKQEIAVRLCYAFGNMANHVPEIRNQLVFFYDGIKVFVKVAVHYFQLLSKNYITKKDDNVSDEEDVLIKVVRVIANLSMSEECGKAFSNYENCIKLLLKILEKHEEYKMCDELLINTAATINNLSFYATPDSFLTKYKDSFASAFLQMLLLENSECASEAMRVLGNFTQAESVRDILIQQNGMEVVITFLDSSDTDMIFCACGVLINMMMDIPTRSLIKELQGIQKLIVILKDIGESDWCLAGLICQILWNYSERITTSAAFFGEEETDDLITVLTEFLEPELALDYENEEDIGDDTIDFLKDTWESQFEPVASLLLYRIESHHSNLEPLNTPPG